MNKSTKWIAEKLHRILSGTGIKYETDPRTIEYKFYSAKGHYLCRLHQVDIIKMSDAEIWHEITKIFYA